MRRIIDPSKAEKDEDGAYVKPASIRDEGQPSLDGLLAMGLLAIKRSLQAVNEHITSQYPLVPDREAIMDLKDIMSMLHELKKKESEILEELSTEDLEKLKKDAPSD